MTHFRKVPALFASLVLLTAVLAAFFGLLASHHTAYAASHTPRSCSTETPQLEIGGVQGDVTYINVYLWPDDSTLTGSGSWGSPSGAGGYFAIHPGNAVGVNAQFGVSGHGTINVGGTVTWNSGQSCANLSGSISV